MTIYHIQLRRGLKADLPMYGELGEPFFTTDTHELFIGQGPNNPLAQVTGGGEFLPLTGGTISGDLNVTGTITGNIDDGTF